MVPASGDARVIALGIATLSLLIWIGLALGRDGFWLTRERDDRVPPLPDLPPLPEREGPGVGRPVSGRTPRHQPTHPSIQRWVGHAPGMT